MTRHVLQILSVLGLILVLTQCAQIVPLSGGKKDSTPPKLLEAIPANNTIGFKADYITLKFDEYTQVKDLSNQLVITPRLKTTPDISAEGKKIIVKLKQSELAPNTTYRFYFGKAIADMNESNSIPDFEYVFSTGDRIDTLEVKGTISEAFNNKPSADILIGLYNPGITGDSLIYKKEPDYVTRSNESGSFTLKNLPGKTFKVFAFSDKNKNSLYDGESEKVAFLGTDLQLGSDTTIHLNLFQEEASKSFIKKTVLPYFGFAQILLNKRSRIGVSTLKPGQQADIYEVNAGQEKDTIALYYKNISDTLNLVLNNITAGKTDTLRLSLPKNASVRKRFKSFTLNTTGNKLLLYDKLRFTFLTWMDTSRSDLSKIQLSSKDDSLVRNLPVKGRWQSINTFEIDPVFKEGMNYTLKVDTGAFFDLKQFTNDSNKVSFITQSKIELGKLTLKLLLNKKQNYIIQLLNEQGTVIKEQYASFSLSSSNAVTLDFIDIVPGIYMAKIIYDDNNNKKWDSGNILMKRQPEKVIINSKQLKILSDWEIEEEIVIKE